MWVEDLPALCNVRATSVCLIAGIICLGLVRRSRQKRYRLPPGPTPLPIVGNAIELSTSKLCAYKNFREMSKQPGYEKIFTVYLGRRLCVVLNHVDTIREATGLRSNDFANRPDTLSGKLFGNNGKSILFGDYADPVWQIQRKMTHKALRKYATGESLEIAVSKSWAKMTEALERELHNPVDIHKYLSFLTFNVACYMTIGEMYDIDHDEVSQARALFLDMLSSVGGGLTADYFPFFTFIPTSAQAKMTQVSQPFVEMLREKIKEHRKCYDSNNLVDVTDYLINYCEEAEKEGCTFKLDEDNMVVLLLGLIRASIFMLVNNLIHAVVYSLQNQEKTAIMVKEIDRVVGTNVPTNCNRKDLVYTEAFLDETMRIATPVPFIFLSPICDSTLGGYDVPKGTVVLANIWAVHHDPNNFASPEEFCPERFVEGSKESTEMVLNKQCFMPFSEGRRKCIGTAMSKNMIMLTLVKLYQRYEFNTIDNKPLEVELEPLALGHIPKKFKISVRKRIE